MLDCSYIFDFYQHFCHYVKLSLVFPLLTWPFFFSLPELSIVIDVYSQLVSLSTTTIEDQRQPGSNENQRPSDRGAHHLSRHQ